VGLAFGRSLIAVAWEDGKKRSFSVLNITNNFKLTICELDEQAQISHGSCQIIFTEVLEKNPCLINNHSTTVSVGAEIKPRVYVFKLA
jgi:hypothetical protein